MWRRALGTFGVVLMLGGTAQAQDGVSPSEVTETPLPDALPEPLPELTRAPLADPRVPALYASDEEELEEPVENPPLTQGAEVAIGMAPSVSLGLGGAGLAGLAGLVGFGLGARTDFVFATDPRLFLGFGLRVMHSETAGSVALGASQTNQVEVPLVFQLYLDTPRRGAAVPTVRIVPAFRWLNQEGASPQALLGGRIDVGVGVTFFVADWLAIRILGDVGTSVDVSYEGPSGNAIQAYVSCDLGLVVRL